VTGPTGPTGALGTTVVRDSLDGLMFTPGDILQVIASCDPGEVLLSGGFTVEAADPDLVNVVPIQSGPTAQPNEWVARIIGTGSTTGVVTLRGFVVCAVP
jgi:hypothetical protein